MTGRNFDRDKHRDYYQSLRKNVRDWIDRKGHNHKYAEYVLAAPDLFHLLCKLSLDSRVSLKNKAKLAGAIVYFLSPIDIIPEALLGPVGYIDDLGLSAYVIQAILQDAGHETVKEHWAGEQDILDLIRDLLDLADRKIGSGAWETIISYID
ncbi:MAG: YkvA family protein [bacterium]